MLLLTHNKKNTKPNQTKTKTHQRTEDKWPIKTVYIDVLHLSQSQILLLCGQLIPRYKYNKLLTGVTWIALLNFLYCKSKKFLKIFCSGDKGLVSQRFYIISAFRKKKYIDWDHRKQTNWTKLRFGKRRIYIGHITNDSHLSLHVPCRTQPKIVDVRCVPNVDSVKGFPYLLNSLVHLSSWETIWRNRARVLRINCGGYNSRWVL